MIGRFLLGAGLGGLVGTGLLALASVVSPPPQTGGSAAVAEAAVPSGAATDPQDTGTVTAALADPAAVTPTESGVEAEAESASESTAEPAPEITAEPSPDVMPDSAPESGPDLNPAATPEPVGDSSATAAGEPAFDAAPMVPEVALSDEGLPAGGLPATEADPTAPAFGEAPSALAPPEALAGLDGDSLPQPAETPAAAPDLALATAPDTLPDTPPEPNGESPAAEAPASDLAAPATLADPDQPGAPPAESAPMVAEMPELPPLTPEEEALLRKIAEEGPGSALPPELLPEEIPAGTEADAQPEAVAPQPAEQVVVLDPAATPSTLPSSPALSDGAAGVRIIRLPGSTDSTDTPVAAAADTLPEVADARPLVKFAQAFDNPEGKPVFAIVLIDDGSDGLDRAALAALPFPVSFALDPTDPKAAEHAAIYRAGGQEVVIMAASLFKGASASDVAVSLEAMASALPESVAVMDTPDHAFQGDRPLASLVVPVIGGQGRGVLSWDQGLNAADQVARREDVPAASAFRDLDGAAEAAPVIRRYLDRAAFKAAQEGRVLVVGRTRPETIAAILEWTVEGRAATVALAPVSAVLTTN